MSITLLISIAAFVGVAALVGGVAMILRGPTDHAVEERLGMLTGTSTAAKKKAENESTVITKPLDDVPNQLEAFAAKLLNIRLLLEQANLPLSPGQFMLTCGALTFIGIVSMLFTPLPVWTAPIVGLSLGILPVFFALFMRKRRKKAFAKQLPEALELIARALRAGHSLQSGFNLVASEMTDPIGAEFQRCYEEQNLGIPMDEALDELANRVPNMDLRFFATAVILQRTTGGDLAEILDKIGYIVRERFKIWGQVQALTGEGRLSGIVLLALPPTLFITMLRINYDYIMMLFQDELGKKMLAFGIVMQLLGAIVIKKIVNIKV